MKNDSGKSEVYQVPVPTKASSPVRQNYNKTVAEGIPHDCLEGFDTPVENEMLRVWGNGADESADSGDYLLFADREGRSKGHYTLLAEIACARILGHDRAERFSEAVEWRDSTDKVFPHVMFLESVFEVELDREKFWNLLGFRGWPNDTYSRINFERRGSNFHEAYGSVQEFTEEITEDQIYSMENPGSLSSISSGDPFSGNSLSELKSLIESESSQQGLYRRAAAHLVAGKNVVFYGPPGTGKTRAANLLSNALCESDSLVTANAEWSNYQVVGGYRPAGETWEVEPGFLTAEAEHCAETLRSKSRPSWLIIDELNRANLDEAFGDVFTLLDVDYRKEEFLSYAGEKVPVPLSFRILATMNTYDQAQLFSLGYAFRRRFAFIQVPSLLKNKDQSEKTRSGTPSLPWEPHDLSKELTSLIEEAAVESMCLGTNGEGLVDEDVAAIFPEFANERKLKKIVAGLRNDSDLGVAGLAPTETLIHFSTEVIEKDIIDVGQALLIDAVKYLIAHQLLFPEATSRSTLDDAVVAHIVPQFEHFMSDLRRSETIDQDSDAKERFEQIIDLARDLSLHKTARALTQAKETKQLLR